MLSSTEKLESAIRPHLAAILAIDLGAPIVSIRPHAGLSQRERNAGIDGRVYIFLGDDAPGWRNKDAAGKRREIKRRVIDLLGAAGVKVSCHIQASYSCLDGAGGMVVRRDNGGKIIGAYEA